MSANQEKDLVIQYKKIKEIMEAKALELLNAKKVLDKIEFELIELMRAQEKESTAKYEGVGHISMLKPVLHASCNKADESKLFEFLKKAKREDLIKTSVNAKSLTTMIKEYMEGDKPFPNFIKYYLEQKIKFYAAK